MEPTDLLKTEEMIQQLSDKFQRALAEASEASVLLRIKQDLEYWKETRNRIISSDYRRAS
jgi:DNA-binding GntR family transcriptional regulator